MAFVLAVNPRRRGRVKGASKYGEPPIRVPMYELGYVLGILYVLTLLVLLKGFPV